MLEVLIGCSILQNTMNDYFFSINRVPVVIQYT